jgi:23S rRNA A2030 N6-methylase RlmJ
VREWDVIDEAIPRAARALPSATILLWYPIKAGPPHEGRADALRDALSEGGARGVSIELRLRGGLVLPKATNPRVRGGLVGTGLVLLGAPGRALARLSSALPELSRMMARPEHEGAWEVVMAGWGG